MALGIYVHIPYCIQRCSYCDFATYEKSSILPPLEYIELVKKEIQVYGPLLRDQFIAKEGSPKVDTLYFGGGTPSLVEAELLVSIITSLKNMGFLFSDNTEITIEINPATIDLDKLKIYQQAGINRFSVGAQTFRDSLLKRVGREHNAHDTQKTLEILANHQLNYTFDLLFALPGQTLEDLQRDLEWVKHFNPKHLSAYCLTVPEGHPLSKAKLPEALQVDMFTLILDFLKTMGLERYEISNFALPGFESRHNMIYWTDENYWGIGLSAHSYIKDDAWGKRFWNQSNIKEYTRTMNSLPKQSAKSILDHREVSHFELLKEHQALTDYCHTFLRINRGLSLDELESKFNFSRREQVQAICSDLMTKGMLEASIDHQKKRWRLTSQGILISNQVFEALTFLD